MKTAQWPLTVVFTAISLYWLSNAMRWYPWIISPTLGMVLMLTAGTALWAGGIYFCLECYSGTKLLRAAVYTALVMLLISALSDFLFFGIIRGAMQELYHATTLYGYGFVVSLSFLEELMLKKHFARPISLSKSRVILSLVPGIGAFLLLTLVSM